MPWQELVADVGLELLPDGRPAYRLVIVTVPRQSGKTTLVLSWETERALYWAARLREPQRITYSAQTQKDAREKLVEDQFPILDPHRKALQIRTFRRAIGSEGILWRNGSRLGIMAGTEASGHGKTLDLGVKDELFADADFRRDQSMGPAMITRPFAQMLTASTMGTAGSVALNAEVEMGRQSVDEGRCEGVAYFEWSAFEDDDPGDPEVWRRCMPALGRTISEDLIRLEYDKFVAEGAVDEFRRAYLNIPTASDQRVIPAAAWSAVCGDGVEATAEVFAVDANPERSHAGIVAVGSGPTVEVVDYRPGTAWLVERCVELADRYRCQFVIDKSGPAGTFIAELQRRRVHVIEMPATDMAKASGAFFDAVVDGQVKVRTNPDLDRAVAGAVKRPMGEAWAWGRKISQKDAQVDICLLVAATAGLWTFLAKASPKVVSLADALREAGEL